MNTWKKVLALVLVFVLAMAMTACGGKKEEAPAATEAPAAEEPAAEEEAPAEEPAAEEEAPAEEEAAAEEPAAEEEAPAEEAAAEAPAEEAAAEEPAAEEAPAEEAAAEEAPAEEEAAAEEPAAEEEAPAEEAAAEEPAAEEAPAEEAAAEAPAEEAAAEEAPAEEAVATESSADVAPIEVPKFDGGTLEVRIWDNNQLAGLQQIADEWSALSGVKVNMQVIDWDNYWTMLEAGASGGEMPDVFWMHSNTAQMYMGANQLLDLTPYIEASSQTDLANYLPGVTELYSMDGKQFALPKDHDTIGLLYNKKLFEKYGVEEPNDNWTWDDYYNAAKAIRDAAVAAGDNDVYGMAMDTTNNQDGYYNIIYSYGGYVISDDKKSSGWDNENTKKAMEFVGKLLQDAGTPQGTVSESGTDRLFKSELAAMITQGTWMILDFQSQDNAADFRWAMLPYYDANGNGACDAGERATIYNGLGWAASAKTKNPDAAWSLIEWFGSKAMQLKQAELGVTMAAYNGCSAPFAAAFGETDVSAFIRMETDATLIFRPYSKYTTRWETESQQKLVPAWSDPSQMDTVLDGLAASMNNWLAQE